MNIFQCYLFEITIALILVCYSFRSGIQMKRHADPDDSSDEDSDCRRASKRGRIPQCNGSVSPVACRGADEGQAKDSLERLVTEKVEGMVHKLFEVRTRSKSENIKGDVIIPLFDPNDKENNVYMWLKKINQLGDIYGWDDSKRAYYMQARLDGAARKWYNRLDNYDFTWEQWQDLLKRTFPRMFEYSEILEELILIL